MIIYFVKLKFYPSKLKMIGHPTVVSLSTATLKTADTYLDFFCPMDLSKLTLMISSSKSLTCLVDPIPTRLFSEVLPLINAAVSNMINISLSTGYIRQAFRVAVIKPLLKNPLLRPIFDTLISRILEGVFLKQLTECFTTKIIKHYWAFKNVLGWFK